ncbi:cobalamin biosynthesis protein CobD [Geobacter sulfurreducens]|uniref:Cobalamin biosynthesis protein CobD n=1 Tax=Geobacter sulfurreducens (strain ATCC 51573 / DSM 12127 / PCA) TaxID=243231 RepID=Q748L1_GEOSL|nr:adenosylcobinamide-phosphate synthase CbiB [Geobacter sulfurreducens]AAR36382.1 adenosylcobinamide-phosphate synthase [Geobacter sulfurreducens PCA]ADI85745.1 adenosylcobinamide-phosphate synthase [Geobacter sulfurreducens KN400]QVW34798.1 cobalamin biosynthesis protein CobD [Geobacter sulfurreducens]UAC03666.1 adenosylcobinamide-phosphate synthase CbiB [Geobacter sulfurreducens]HBB70402.1 cobalamin biosynthesis protein CobD [Geobacter sulfurreducens]
MTGPDRVALLVLAALVLDWLLGDPRWLPHPVVAVGRLVTALERQLRRLVTNERAAGVILLVLTVGITGGTAWLLVLGAGLVHPVAGFAVEALLGWTCLAARSLHGESKLVADALAAGDLAEARFFLSRIVGRDTAELTEPEIWRGVVETVAENTSDGVIAPLFWFMIGGAPLALAYKAVNTLDSMVGYKNERYLHFGWASARFDDLVNLLPARITGLLMVLSAPLAGLSGPGAWRIMRRDGRNHSSPNAGIPEAAAAGALGVRLGGMNVYFGRPVAKPTIGDPLNPLDRTAWRGAVRLMYGSEILLTGFMLCYLFVLERP